MDERLGAIEILLVEDNAQDAELAIRALQKRNLANHLHHVEDGAEALEFFFGENAANRRPRLVLLDLKLPKVDGLEVLRELRQREKTRTIAVVDLTSSHEDRDLRTAYSLGVNSYIVKPVDFNKFAAVVAQLGMYWLLVNEPSKP